MDCIESVTYKDGKTVRVPRRTAAVLAQVLGMQDRLESQTKGQLEISIHFGKVEISCSLREFTPKMEID